MLVAWLWLSGVALLFGAELDAEIERARELQAGIPAEAQVQLPVRDSRGSERAEAKHAADVAAGRRIREQHSPPER